MSDRLTVDDLRAAEDALAGHSATPPDRRLAERLRTARLLMRNAGWRFAPPVRPGTVDGLTADVRFLADTVDERYISEKAHEAALRVLAALDEGHVVTAPVQPGTAITGDPS